MDITHCYISKLIELTPEQKEIHSLRRQQFEELTKVELIEWIQQVSEFHQCHIQATKGLFQENQVEPTLSLEKQFQLASILLNRKAKSKAELLEELMSLLEKVEQLKNGMALIPKLGDQDPKVGVDDYLSYLETQML